MKHSTPTIEPDLLTWNYIREHYPQWKKKKAGTRWPKEIQQSREWMLTEFPLQVPAPKEFIDGFMHTKYEGRVMWLARNEITGRNTIGYLQKAYIASPDYWDLTKEDYNPWTYGAGIIIHRKHFKQFKEGINKLRTIFEQRKEENYVDTIIHSIPCGRAVGPYSSLVLRFYIERYAEHYSYRLQTFRCVPNEDGSYGYKYNRHIFLWKDDACERFFKAIDKITDILALTWKKEDEITGRAKFDELDDETAPNEVIDLEGLYKATDKLAI